MPNDEAAAPTLMAQVRIGVKRGVAHALDKDEELLKAIARVGRGNPRWPPLHLVAPFRHFFSDGHLDRASLDRRDGTCTRREIVTRFLLLDAVVGHDCDSQTRGLGLVRVTNALYRREVRFLHKPLAFFGQTGTVLDEMLQPKSAKGLRIGPRAAPAAWHMSEYVLFLRNSEDVLSCAMLGWGVVLRLFLLLESAAPDDYLRASAVLDWLESHESAEGMSRQLRKDQRYGLGGAIGDRACHLVAKWLCVSFRVTRRDEYRWGPFSFEVPFDSNAGRVLWRTGFFLRWASLRAYTQRRVVQPGQGKGGLDYIRVTNIRGMKTTRANLDLLLRYREVCTEHMKTHKKAPQKVDIQRIPHALLLSNSEGLTPAELDDGLVHIGTRFCFNHAKPECDQCPVGDLCEGNTARRELITQYRT